MSTARQATKSSLKRRTAARLSHAMDSTNNEATHPTVAMAYQHHTSPTSINDYSNILFFFAPLGIAAGALEWDVRIIFAFNFIALVPSARLFSTLTRQLSNATGLRISRALGVILCNGVEMIVGLHIPN
jgi:hypothetical protein